MFNSYTHGGAMLDLRVIQGVCRRTGRGVLYRIRSMHTAGHPLDSCDAQDGDERNALYLANVVGLMDCCKLWT